MTQDNQVEEGFLKMHLKPFQIETCPTFTKNLGNITYKKKMHPW